MAALLALLSALCYGSSDFAAGWGGRRATFGAVTIIGQPFGLVAALVALTFARGQGPAAGPLLWGALSGVGSGVGTVILYRGLTLGRMSVVAPLSAVVTSVVPVLVGLALGERLAALPLAGVVLAVPASLLVSLRPVRAEGGVARGHSGVVEGLAAGAAFALLFIALDRAGTRSGAWPLVPGQAVAVVCALGIAWRSLSGDPGWRKAARPAIAAGILGGAANLLFLAATGPGRLAVVAVLTALYPAVTIVLARLVLEEGWSRVQVVGLILAGLAIVLITAG